MRSFNNNSTFDPATVIVLRPDHPYYQMLENRLVKRPYHEEGGIYTVMDTFDEAGRGKILGDASDGRIYSLRRIGYSQEQLEKFGEVCRLYCFHVSERNIQWNDDLAVEKEIDHREYTKEIPLEDLVVSGQKVIGVRCVDRLLRLDDPQGRVQSEVNFKSISYYQSTSCKQVYKLMKKAE